MGSVRLLRHGETDDNREPVRVQGRRDVGLNDRGKQQAQELAGSLERSAPDALYSSSLLRARETAEILGTRLGLVPTYDERFAETDRGNWEGRLFEEIAIEEPEAFKEWRESPAAFRFPGGESLEEQQRRVVEAIEDVRSAGHEAPLVVCHGGSIRVALCHYGDKPLDEFHSWEVSNGSVIEL